MCNVLVYRGLGLEGVYFFVLFVLLFKCGTNCGIFNVLKFVLFVFLNLA